MQSSSHQRLFLQIHWYQLKSNTHVLWIVPYGEGFPHLREQRISCKLLPCLAFSVHKDEEGSWIMRKLCRGITICKLEFHGSAGLFGGHLFLSKILHAFCNVWLSHWWNISSLLLLTTCQQWFTVGFSLHVIDTSSLWPECIRSHTQSQITEIDQTLEYYLCSRWSPWSYQYQRASFQI